MTALCNVLSGNQHRDGVCRWYDDETDEQWEVVVHDGVAYTFCFWSPLRFTPLSGEELLP